MKINKSQFKESVVKNLKTYYGVLAADANDIQVYDAVSRSAMEIVADNMIATKESYAEQDVKQAYYLSAEFLMGRAMSNNLVNLTIEADVKEALEELGINYNKVEDSEPDSGLGNGGLGRLAACFLDSLATLELPGHGYGIKYKYGMFEQQIIDGFQYEVPDEWLKDCDPWTVERRDEAVEVKFGGHVSVYNDHSGREFFKRENAEVVTAVPFDMPIVAYGNKTVNTLRLWEAQSPIAFDLQLFNDQDYLRSVERGNLAEDISRVLYPNDSGPSGKALRLKQQYFFVSASIQDIINKFKKKHGEDNWALFPEKVAMQLNDTHPVVAIPELMRILMDWEKLDWDTAWAIVTKTCAYTNHTILAEALEKWPIDLFSSLLPRIYQIVEEINRRFLIELREAYPGDWAKHHSMAIIADGMIKMAWLAIVGTHSVNGVAALHTEILKNSELADWYNLYPAKFNNKTNGVTQRRWLLKSNPELANLLTEKIGDSWITNLADIEKFAVFADDKEVLDRFMKIKYDNKVVMAEYVKEHNGVELDPNSIFDIQIKRLHEYKRQLLNILHIMSVYNKLKENPDMDYTPRTFLFGAKSASGYKRAKDIIKLINSVGDVVNNDPAIGNKLKVVFIENYRVSVAEKMFPSADLSEQISTAGKEASGTGNMKFMMSGAPTIGTLDGANVEIVEEAGIENNFIFGLTSDEVDALNQSGTYNPWDIYNTNSDVKKVIDQLVDGTYGKQGLYDEIYNSLMYGVDGNGPDQYYVLKDFAGYAEAQERVGKAFTDKDAWAKMALLNTAKSGKFSSDRTIQQYADEIWDIKATKVK